MHRCRMQYLSIYNSIKSYVKAFDGALLAYKLIRPHKVMNISTHVVVYYLIKVNLGDIYFLTLFKLREIFLTNSQPWHDGCKAFRADMLPPTAEHLPSTQKLNGCPNTEAGNKTKLHKSMFQYFFDNLINFSCIQL